MADNTKLPKMRLLLITAALAAGLGHTGSTAFAAASVSERDMFDQAVALYEKLSGNQVEVPSALSDISKDPVLVKAVTLGFANSDELTSEALKTSLRKQDAMTVLYKTIINFDDSFALSADEVDEIMNKCYDNVHIDEKNRVGYAFMIKHGVVSNEADTEPDKPIGWDSCRILVDVLYDLFMQDTIFDVNGTSIHIGANIETVTDILGEPDRIDKSDYDFDWYVYNSDYNNFMMVGVDEGRICAFFSNSDNFSLDGILAGDPFTKTYKYEKDSSYRFFEGKDGTVDGFIYNPRSKSDRLAENSSAVRGAELADIINSYRTKHGIDTAVISTDLWEKASQMAVKSQYAEIATNQKGDHIADDAEHYSGYDVCSLYNKLLRNDSEILTAKTKSIGIGTYVLPDYTVTASIAASGSEADDIIATSSEDVASLPDTKPTEAPTAEPTEAPKEDEEQTETEVTPAADAVFSTISQIPGNTITLDAENLVPHGTEAPESQALQTVSSKTQQPTEAPTAEPTAAPNAPIITSPENESVIEDGKDVTIELEESAANEYLARIYSIEDDKYIVDSYIKTDESKLTFESHLFEPGKDYTISISAVTETGTVEGKKITIRYGEAPEGSVRILSPIMDSISDDDSIELEWESSVYHDFVIDMYNGDGKLVLHQTVSGDNKAEIKNVDPGEYYVYVSAVRRGDRHVVKLHDYVRVELELPEPVISEYILEPGERLYPIYEDTTMGLVTFYDEEIIEDSNGKKRKKITEKQIKATSKYKLLAGAQQRVEYFEGSDKLQTEKKNTPVYSLSASATGKAICDEAAKYLGVPYVWGGTSPLGFDCSGLVQYVFRSLGMDISRTTYTQINEGIPVSREELQPGDLVFFARNGDVHHVGIYVGNGTMLHAPNTGSVVQYQSIDTPYYASQFCGGRRFVTN